MTYHEIFLSLPQTTVQFSSFLPKDGIGEWHAMLHVVPQGDSFESQLARLYKATEELLALPEFSTAHCVAKRYFLSDSTNQAPLLREEENVALSVIGQAPLNGSKVALWIYLQENKDITKEGAFLCTRHNGYRHLWHSDQICPSGNSATQTQNILEEYQRELAEQGLTMEKHCIRTWFFVRDVDTQYQGMVKARRENFAEQNMTGDTHYLASTGIGGNPANTSALLQMGSYAIDGLEEGQQRYLYALSHLNRTIEYGVTFERGTLVEYGDREELFISGTASIDNQGNVMYVGDIHKQTLRMWENVEALLKEGEAGFEDMAQIIVYLRDIADYQVVKEMFDKRFPHIPTMFCLAPVCRPSWLIEMECIATKCHSNSRFRSF